MSDNKDTANISPSEKVVKRVRVNRSGGGTSFRGVSVNKDDPLFGSNVLRDSGSIDLDNSEIIREIKNYQSNQLIDPFINEYAVTSGGGVSTLRPPFNPYTIRRLPQENNTLGQCIDAMVTNIESYGYRLDYVGEDGQEDSPAALAEKDRLESILEQPNGEYSLIELRERLRKDIETFGYGFIEVGRDGKNNITTLFHVPAHTMRLTTPEDNYFESKKIFRRNGKDVPITLRKKYRTFIQEFSGKRTFFKEFGDPRAMDYKTGKRSNDLSIQDQATEIVHVKLYNSGTAYGMPRWMNQMPSVLGSREAELTNLDFFKNNAIPVMAVLVSGAMLTEGSIEAIEEHFNVAKGRESQQRIMVIEASPDDTAGQVDSSVPTPRLDLKPLGDDRQKDALFQDYDKQCEAKVRSSFRLPPLFIGRAEDYTRATAQTSLVVAEAQVFLPERNKIDDLFNMVFLSDDQGMQAKYWKFRSNPPRLVGSDSIVDALKELNALGGVTPNIAIGLTNELFDLDIRMVNEEWGNYPFNMVMKLLEQQRLKGIEPLLSDLSDADFEDDDSEDPLSEEGLEVVEETIKKPFEAIKELASIG